MKIATAAYPLSWFETLQDYDAKIETWVRNAADQGADLLVFPEYAAMELASVSGEAVSGDLHGSIQAVSDRFDHLVGLHATLAARYGVHILSGSAPVQDGKRVVNRAGLFAPNGKYDFQDKQIMTRFEREEWGVAGGGGLQIFQTELGKIGILICYDSEFPLLGRSFAEADMILVPSCTEALAGYWRVRIGAMARALEQQCITVMASLVGDEPRLFAVEENTGMGGIFCPPDKGLPPTGVIAEGVLNTSGWTIADVDLAQIAEVRRDGVVLNRTHWDEQTPRDMDITSYDLR